MAVPLMVIDVDLGYAIGRKPGWTRRLLQLRWYIAEKRFDLCAKAQAPITISFIPRMYHACRALRFLRSVTRYFAGHAQGRLDGHAHLQRRGCSKEKSATRDVQRFRKMLGLIGTAKESEWETA